MTWVRLDDGFPHHPKVVGLPLRARWLYITGLCYAARYLTDGYLPRAIADVWEGSRTAAMLVAAGLWTEYGDEYVIHDYLEWNPSRTDVELRRESDRKRKRIPQGIRTESLDGSSTGVRGRGGGPGGERARDPLFDALAEACGADPRGMTEDEARACGVALAKIRKATPGIDPEGIGDRARNYAARMPNATLTPSALARHWSASSKPPTNGSYEAAEREVQRAVAEGRLR